MRRGVGVYPPLCPTPPPLSPFCLLFLSKVGAPPPTTYRTNPLLTPYFLVKYLSARPPFSPHPAPCRIDMGDAPLHISSHLRPGVSHQHGLVCGGTRGRGGAHRRVGIFCWVITPLFRSVDYWNFGCCCYELTHFFSQWGRACLPTID